MSDSRSLNDEGARSKVFYVLGGICVVAAAFFVTLYLLDWLSGPPVSQSDGVTPPTSAPADTGPAATQPSPLSALPKLPTAGFSWIGISNINAQVVDGTPAVAGTPVVRFASIPTSGPHLVALQATGLDKGRIYRIAVWAKTAAGGNIEIEAGDHAGTNPSYGVGLYNLNSRSAAAGTSSVRPGIASGPGDWEKIWLDLSTSTGQLFFALYVLNAQGKDFLGDGRVGFTFGGVSLEPQS